MDCATVYVDVDEYCTELSRSKPKARKDHICNECKELINTGEIYERIVTLFDGKFDEYKTCMGCVSIRDEFFKEGWFYGNIIEAFREHIRDCGGIISESAISMLNVGGIEKVSDMLKDYWTENDEE